MGASHSWWVGVGWGGGRHVASLREPACIIDSMDISLSKLQETVKDRKAWHTAVERLNNNTTTSSVVVS